MAELADVVCAYVRQETDRYRDRKRRPDRRLFVVGVDAIARALDIDEGAVATAVRKGEDRGRLTCHGDPVHSVEVDERGA